jgi:RNA polymerase sigma factor for flagellar operon FliA
MPVKQKSELKVNDLWAAYKKAKSKEVRDKLILHYAPLVKYVAGRIAASLPSNVEQADLISYGMFGLIDAIERYNPAHGVKFETYAITRIKGAIIDELRALDWVPRSLRQKAKDIEKVYVELEYKLKRVPTDKEVAEALGISLEEHQAVLSQLNYSSILALDELWGTGDKEEKISILDSVEDDSSPDPSKVFELEELKKLLESAIAKLSDREKTIVFLYYYEGFTLREIGEILGISESRVSQLHTKAILRLKSKLRMAQSA